MNAGDSGGPTAGSESTQRWRLLLAEDEPLQRRLFEHTLAEAGYDVEAVESGEDALQRILHGDFHMLITDWGMPGLDGAALCRKIRGAGLRGHLHILMVSGHLAVSDLADAIDAGADDYLRKPADHAELLARVKSGCRIVALTHELNAAYTRLHEYSITDPLVRTYNRGYLDEQLPRAIAAARRYERPLSVVLSDLDEFKRINDEKGHGVGDEVLRCFCERARQSIRRPNDWIARYGTGDEFVFVLPETKLSDAVAVAEKLRIACTDEPMQTSKGFLPVTASFGVAALPSAADPQFDAAVLLQYADAALYRAKRAGRNRVNI